MATPASPRLRRLAGVLLPLVLLVASADPAAAQSERILSFASDVTVQPDGALQVEETIEVVAAGDAIKRGIFRDFPTRRLTPAGFNRINGFDVKRVERDGAPEPYFLAPLNAGIRVYIGREAVTLPPGRHRYTIVYRTDRQLLHRPGEDELYWNVTGDAWAFPIERASVTVHLPAGATPIRVAAYTGAPGARGADFEAVTGAEGVRLATTRTLPPGQGFTIAVVWPEGRVARPTADDALAALAADNKGVWLGWTLVAVLIGYFAVAWYRVGRDPEKGVIIPLFEAPAGLSPVAVGYIWHSGFRTPFDAGRAMTVAITSLATKRRIVIDDDGQGGFALAKEPASGKAGLPAGERAVYRAVFANGADTVRFGDSYEPRMGRASRALLDAFDWEYGRAYFRTNSNLWLLGAAVAVAAVLSSLSIDARGEDAWFLAPILSVFAIAFATVGLVLVGRVLVRISSAIATGSGYRLLRSLAELLGAVPAFLVAAGVAFIMTDMVAPAALLPAAVAAVVTVAFWYLLKAPTRLGRKTLDAIEGYRLYLSVAESDRLNTAGREPAVTEALFERHLPYAMALGVEDAWTAKVTARLAASLADPDQRRRGYAPDWYRHRGGGGLTPGALAGALSQNLGGAAAHASTQPSSSGGSSSGGSSGGGGGGGGGGGW